jgi:uncharacterized membrane protein
MHNPLHGRTLTLNSIEAFLDVTQARPIVCAPVLASCCAEPCVALSWARIERSRFRSAILIAKGTIMSESIQSGITDNGAGGIAYVTPIPAIILLMIDPYKTRPYIRFHAFQSIFLFLTAFVFWIAVSFVVVFGMVFGTLRAGVIAPLFWMAVIIVFVLCAVSALNGKYFKLPIIGAIADRLANK